MIEGIQILNETTKWTADGWTIVGAIFCILIALICLVFTIMLFSVKEPIGILTLILTAIVIFGCYTIIDSYVNRYEYKEYQVLINDSVKMNEFNAKYSIINQDGNIFTIVEKDINK